MGPTIDFGDLWATVGQREAFVVGEDDFTDLELRPVPNKNFSFFYDIARSALVKRFVLGTTPRTETYCLVRMIPKGEKYEPRLDVRIDNTSGAARERAEQRIEDGDDGHLVKASVSLDAVHQNFWQLVDFLSSFPDVELPRANLAVVEADVAAAFASLLAGQDRSAQLQTLQSVLGDGLSEADVRLLVDRRQGLHEFERLMTDEDYRRQRVAGHSGNGEEPMWQDFFETHPWIFGYGLKLIACEAFDEQRLEQTVTGADVTGAGDVVDALMTTHGQIRSLMFVEMKRPDTDLLARRPRAGDHDEYRSGVFRASAELTGAVSQVQVTSHRAVRRLDELHRARDDGYLADDIGTIQPRQVVIIGQLDEFKRDDDIHPDHYRSFELYRRSIKDIEIITFDELLARARFIVAQEDLPPDE